MSSSPEYLTMDLYMNRCNHDQRGIVDDWFRDLFTDPKINITEPLNVEGLRLFVMLGLFYPLKCDVRCMGRSGRNLENRRCQNTLNFTNLSNSLQRLWNVAWNTQLQEQSLLHAIYEVCKHFLCESQHRKEVARKMLFAEELAKEWYPIFEQFRHINNIRPWPQQQRQTVAGAADVKPVVGANGWAAHL